MDAVDRYLGLPPTGLPGMLAPTGHHHERAHARPTISRVPRPAVGTELDPAADRRPPAVSQEA